jgi:hypothetical protein
MAVFFRGRALLHSGAIAKEDFATADCIRLGDQDSGMVKYYFHLHDVESKRQMDKLNPLGGVDKAEIA